MFSLVNMSNSSSSCWANFNGFYYSLIVFFGAAGFLDNRACILALRLAFEAGGAIGLAAAGLEPTTGFLTGDLEARVYGLATGLAGAEAGATFATGAWAGLATEGLAV